MILTQLYAVAVNNFILCFFDLSNIWNAEDLTNRYTTNGRLFFKYPLIGTTQQAICLLPTIV